MNTRISVLMTTFRYGGMDLFLSSLANQTFKEPWEIVLVDELYEKRKAAIAKYATELGLVERLKHVPAPPARDGTVINYSRSLNEGLVHCDGECVLFQMDYTYLAPTVLERLWRLHKVFPRAVISGLAHPMKVHPDIKNPDGPITIFDYPLENIDAEKDAERWQIVQDDRFRVAMGIVNVIMLSLMDDGNMYEYGYTVSPNYLVSLESLLNINGYDEEYDKGGHGFDDLDIMSRLKHGAGAEFLVDTQMSSSVYIMEHPWSRLPEEKPNPNRQRHIQRAQAIALGMESPWIPNDRILWRSRSERFLKEFQETRPLKNRGLMTEPLKALLGTDVILKERNPTQLVRLAWVLQQAEGQVLEVGAREGHYPDRDGWIRLDLEKHPKVHIQGNGEALPFAEESFDTVLLAEIIEHVEDPQRLLREALRVSRSRVVITTPNEWVWDETFNPFSQEFKQHRRYYTFASLMKELESALGEDSMTFSIYPLDYNGLSFLLALLLKV